MMFTMSKNSGLMFPAIILLVVVIFISGCATKQTAQPVAKVEVKAMQVITKNAPITEVFVGEITALDEVELKAKVSGQIIEKMVEDGQDVRPGQPLFQIDRRDYEAVLLNRKANLAQAQSELSDTRMDVERYKFLAERDAIARQTLDQVLNKEQQKIALVESNKALVAQAQNDIDDTLIVAPIGGTVRFNSLSKGNFAQAGQTTLATIFSADPVYVKFSMSETSYLQFLAKHKEDAANADNADIKIILSDGATYPLSGKITQIERAVSEKTGTLSLKASFDNPDRILAPGMFARVSVMGDVRNDSMLIPQRAIQEILGKNFVTIVKATSEGDKAESCAVKLGPKYDDFQVVEEGLTPSDKVVVEGLTKVKPGMFLQVVMIGPDELKTPATK